MVEPTHQSRFIGEGVKPPKGHFGVALDKKRKNKTISLSFVRRPALPAGRRKQKSFLASTLRLAELLGDKLINMKVTAEKNEKVANMIFASIYPLYLNRLEKNERTKEELDQVIKWFTGFDQDALQALIDEKATFRTFFQKAKINPNAHLIKGVVCGYRIEEIADEFELYKQCRRMEKLIDELARGRKMEKILREEKK